MSDIKDRINSYEDACAILGRKPLTLADFSALPEADQQPFFSLHKITTAIEAINEGHVFDWNNWEERKYYAWWDMETYGDAPAGSGFSFLVFGYLVHAFDCRLPPLHENGSAHGAFSEGIP